MKGIYRLEIDCGRMGEVEGVFIADSEDVVNIMGKEIYFGEALGKHSEVSETMSDSNLYLLTDNFIAVTVVEKYGLEAGYNPFEYYQPEEE